MHIQVESENQIRPCLERLTDAFLDGTIERELFENRKNALFLEEKDLNLEDRGLAGRNS
jgi:hypothetical protein